MVVKLHKTILPSILNIFTQSSVVVYRKFGTKLIDLFLCMSLLYLSPFKLKNVKIQYRTVHTDSTLWTILAFKMRKWFPNIIESLYLHITSDLIELYTYK